MIKNKNIINVPIQFRHTITPENRILAFKEIVAGYSNLYGLKCIYAFLNQNPDFYLDYLIVFKGKNDEGDHDIILFDAIPINGDRCTPNYQYYKMIGKSNNFFQFGAEEMVVMDPRKFYEFLAVRVGVNKDKKSDKFWKHPDQAELVADELLELSLGYVRKRPSE